MGSLQGHRILIGLSGGIAAYKVCEVISQLFQRGAEVRVILTERAQDFITPLTVATLSRHRAYVDADLWQGVHSRPLHIELGDWAELILLAPLTAQTLAKLAHGSGDNLLTATLLASRCPVLLAPAMNTEMWEQKSVQRNWRLLLEDERYAPLEPEAGLLACDRVGKGRMAEPQTILNRLDSWFSGGAQPDLAWTKILITGGGTQEYLDAARFLGNPSTGKMAVALTQAALDRGAEVVLIHAPLQVPLPFHAHCRRISITSAAEMEAQLQTQAPWADWLALAAAVADLRPRQRAVGKLAKTELPLNLPLEMVPDLAAQLAQGKRENQIIAGFAAQTGEITTPAREKLARKGLDLIVANPIDLPGAGFASETNQAMILDRLGGEQVIPPCSKLELAHQIWTYLRDFQRRSLPQSE
ncbi:MAG: bifunctional phosphopantothenoylcysteine decarboxylase/phosphopantothenate--cysteine ligase CoaBC [Cyanobacteriota bacterium]|jgi:phosphopantothenoylcysteine decarboxylase/phosphopantothenate--cysteine ligase